MFTHRLVRLLASAGAATASAAPLAAPVPARRLSTAALAPLAARPSAALSLRCLLLEASRRSYSVAAPVLNDAVAPATPSATTADAAATPSTATETTAATQSTATTAAAVDSHADHHRRRHHVTHTPTAADIEAIKAAPAVADSQESTKRFDSLPLSPKTLQSLAVEFKYQNMSAVQEKVLELLPYDKDLLVRAKTGTGKTLAFLVAAIESVIFTHKTRPAGVPIVILSPTRELALQIAREAERLVRFHRWIVRTAVGGQSRMRNVRDLSHGSRCDIIVATPGRLNDLLRSEPAVKAQLAGCKVLIFDEADVLLDMGFKDELQQITENLPTQRQTFMFSATLSSEIRSIAASTLERGYTAIDTVPKNETDTHLRIKQTYAVVPHSQQFAILHDAIERQRAASTQAKIIVFFPTTKLTTFAAEVFNRIPGCEVLEMHSKLTQMQRMKIADRFRRASSAVLFTSDVSARGVDYPGVSLVIQFGLPPSRDGYIHRVGRTGRAGKSGEGLIILSPYEKRFLDEMKDVPIRKDLVHVETAGPRDDETSKAIATALSGIPSMVREDVYTSQLGFVLGHMALIRTTKETAYRSTESFATGLLGLPEVPALSSRMAEVFGLSRVPGVKIQGVSSFGRSGEQRPFGMFARREGGDREGSFQRRESGGFGGDREGGFKRREGGGFGGFQRREGGDREGGFQRRDGGSFGGDREGGFRRREGSSFGGDRFGGGKKPVSDDDW